MPTMTFSVAATPDDGHVSGNNSVYPPTVGVSNGSAPGLNLNRTLSLSVYVVDVVLMRWNTSTLPAAATITGAVLRCFVSAVTNANARSVLAEWYSTANWPIDSADYSTSAPATPIASRSLSLITVNALNDLPLSDLSGINTAGYTGIRLHISGSTPTGVNSVTISSFEHATNPEPQLIITYTMPLVDLTGASTGTGTTTGSIEHTVKLTGALVDAVNLIATLYIDKHVFGGLTAAATSNGSLTVIHPLSATASGNATSTANIKVGHLITGATTGTATVPANLKVIHRLSATITGAATATANLKVGHLISGNVTGDATTTASIMVTHHLSGALTGATTATASIQVGHTIAGVATGAVDSTGSLHVTHLLAGATDGSATVTAALRVTPIHISGSVTATGSTAARLLGTFSVTASDDDGYVNSESLVDVTGNVLVVQRSLFSNSVALIRFDSSALPDNATITSARLRLYLAHSTGGIGQPGFDLVGEYYSASNWPIDVADYSGTAPVAPLFSRSSILLIGQEYYDFPFTDFSGIAVAGYIGFRLHVSAPPSAATVGVTVSSGETANGPMLVVNFTTLRALSGTATGIATVTGQLDKSAYLITGVGTGQGVLSASLQLTAQLNGAATGMASLQASVAVTTHLDGTANGAATINAMLNRTIAMVASVEGAATADAGLSVTHHLQGAPIGQGVAGGLLSLPMFIGGALRGTAVLVASITHVVHVDAVVMASATAAVTPHIFKNLTGSPTGQAVVTANLRISHVRMEGVITGQAVSTACLRVAHRMQGFTIGTATAQATMGPVNHIIGVATATAVTVVVLRHIIHARGLVYGQAHTSAVLMWVNIQTIHCEPLTGVHDAPGCTGLSPVATISKENLVTLHTIGK